MPNESTLQVATNGHDEVPPDWMPATQARSFIFEDPGVVWLQHHGKQHGFQPDTSPYEFLDFIAEKGRQFEEKWIEEIAPSAIRVCTEAYDVRSAEKVRETFDLMQSGAPVIVQPALWWAPESIYGVPDILVLTSWLKDKFPSLVGEAELEAAGHYVVLDIKFTTKLDETEKVKDLKSYAAQVRIYSYILGHYQGLMPPKGYLIARDRIYDPLPVAIASTLNQPLDGDLAVLRDQFIDIKVNGASYVPWRDDIVASNISHQDERWRTAKDIIAREKMPGRDSGLLYQIGPVAKRELSSKGFPSLDSMLQADPQKIPFEKCKGLGPAKSKQIRAIFRQIVLGSLCHRFLVQFHPKSTSSSMSILSILLM